MASLSEFKEYAVIDGDANGTAARIAFDGAVAWLKNAGVPEMDDDAAYDLAVYRLATMYFENRAGTPMPKGIEDLPYGVQGIVLQLKDGVQNGQS